MAVASKNLLVSTVRWASDSTVAAEQAAGRIVTGALHATRDVEVETKDILYSTFKGVLAGASDSGADVAKVGLAATKAAIHATGQLGAEAEVETGEILKAAVKAAEGVGVGVVHAVRSILVETIKGAKEVLASPMKK